MSSIVVSTRTISEQESGCDCLIQIINRALTDCGYSEPHRVKFRLHEVLATVTNQASEHDSKQIAQNLAIHYQDFELLHEDIEIVAMNLFSDEVHDGA